MTEHPHDRLRGFARKMRSEPTEVERIIWRLLRAKRLAGFKFKRQVPVGPYIVDFVCFHRRLVVELDGSQHADNPYDEVRDRWFESQGFRVVRFWNSQVIENPEGIADMILRVAEAPIR